MFYNPALRLILVRLASFTSTVSVNDYGVYLPNVGTFKPSKDIQLGQAEFENFTGRGIVLTLKTNGQIMVGPQVNNNDVVRPIGSYVVPIPSDVTITTSGGVEI